MSARWCVLFLLVVAAVVAVEKKAHPEKKAQKPAQAHIPKIAKGHHAATTPSHKVSHKTTPKTTSKVVEEPKLARKTKAIVKTKTAAATAEVTPDVHLSLVKDAQHDLEVTKHLQSKAVQTHLREDLKSDDPQQLLGQNQPQMGMGHPFVEHLGGKNFFEDRDGVRSIVLSPSFGPTSGGTWVQVTGAGSYHTPNSLQCKLDLVEQFCYSNHYFYSWCYMTPKCSGVYPLHCHNGPLQFEGKYAVVAKTPWVTSVYPFSGDTAGGTEVILRGWNFEPHCPQQLLCKFGDLVVPGKFYTSSSVMCVAPCATEKQFVSVEVSNDGGMHWSMSGVQYGYVGEGADAGSRECQRYLSDRQPHHTH